MNLTLQLDDLTPTQLIAVAQALTQNPVAVDQHAPKTDLEALVSTDVTESANTDAASAPPPPPTQLATVTTPELDSNGIPWDARIHASTKTKTVKGEWKRRKGVDDTTFSGIVAELKGSDDIGEGEFKLSESGEAVAATTFAPPPPPPDNTPTGTIKTFADLMVATNAAGLTPTTVQQAVESVGLLNIPALAAKPELVPAVAAVLKL